MIKGRILHADGDVLWLARDTTLWRSQDGGASWLKQASLPVRAAREKLAHYRLGRRLGRVGVHHVQPLTHGDAIVIAHQHVFRLEKGVPVLRHLAPLVGSRPLFLAVGDGWVLYGEYRSNRERTPVHIWAAEVQDPAVWQPVWRFDAVRHIHGVHFDPYTRCFWVTTGDDDAESGLWLTVDRFRSAERVVGGGQNERAVQLLFTERYVYYGSDAPTRCNHLYRLDRRTGHVERLAAVGGPVFYGCKVGGYLFFSTVVEPGATQDGVDSELWGSSDGEDWQCLYRYRKDRWSGKYLQYGQINFPAGPGARTHLWFTPLATRHDGLTQTVALSELAL